MEKEPKLPNELQNSLKILIGERPDSFKEEFEPNTTGYPQFKGTGFGGETTAQEEFIKKKDPVEQKVRYKDNKVFVFDLTDEKDSLEFSRILDEIGDPESGVVLAEEIKDPQILIDPKAKKGYRAIVSLKTTKPEKYLKKKGTGYQVAKKE
jgi:hypothetical protein